MVDKTQEFKGEKGIRPSKDLEINQLKLELSQKISKMLSRRKMEYNR